MRSHQPSEEEQHTPLGRVDSAFKEKSPPTSTEEPPLVLWGILFFFLILLQSKRDDQLTHTR